MTNLADCDGLLVAITHRISAFYLLRRHQRRGIGRALLTHLLAALNKRGAAEARFDVVAINNNAIRFYRAAGAYPVGDVLTGILAIPKI